MSNQPLNFPRLLDKKIDEITCDDLTKLKVFPIDIEEYTRESLNNTLPPVEIETLQYPAGNALKAIDPIRFRDWVCNEERSQIDQGYWIEIDSHIYDKAEVLKCLGVEDEK